MGIIYHLCSGIGVLGMVKQSIYQGRGLFDWLAQRLTACVIAVTSWLIFAFYIQNPHAGQGAWRDFFHGVGIKVLTALSIIAILWHAWLGMWVVYTDYIKSPCMRCLLQGLTILVLMVLFGFSAFLIWEL